MVKIVWTELAVSDLKEIYDFISNDSSRYASITINRIYHRIQPLKDNPKLGRTVPEFKNVTIREVIEGNYRIIYRIVNVNKIDILRIYHSARLLRKKSIS